MVYFANTMRSLLLFSLACLALGLLAACETTSSGPTCEGVGVALCNSACVNSESDLAHCGECDHPCAGGEACEGGACVALCEIGGEPIAAGTVNPTNSCEQCTPATSISAWTPRADGTACNPGQLCAAGACALRCFIGGVLYAAGTPNPANACETCVPSSSTTAWTPRASVPLLVGGEGLAAQGWTIVSQSPDSLTYGADHVRLATSTNGGASSGGQLLVTRANAVDPSGPFTIRVTMQVESVNAHNLLDSGAAILGSFTPPFGNGTDRAQMIYLDSAAIGWSDNTQSAAFAVTDGGYHVYELAVDAAMVATVSVDGVPLLTRNGFTTNGTIALGDQTNDANVDGAVRIRSVERICP